MFFKKCEPRSAVSPCLYVALGMLAAFGVVACTKPGRKFLKEKMSCLGTKLENCSPMSS